MISDPSDGSVKDVDNSHGARSSVTTGDPKAPMPHESGLREPSSKTEYLERLDRSRKWLSDYRTNPERTARLMGETGE